MAAVTVTATQVAPTMPDQSQIYDAIAAAAITAGQPVYINTSGKADLADANAAGKEQARGLALKTVAAGEPVAYIMRGPVAGLALSGVAYDAVLYLSDTAGGIDTAASVTKTVPLGRVMATTQYDVATTAYGKVFMVDCSVFTAW